MASRKNKNSSIIADEVKETVTDEVKETVTEEMKETVTDEVKEDGKKEIMFRDMDGNESFISFSDVKEIEKKLKKNEFKTFAENTSFHDACESGEWNIPYVGLHVADETSEGKEYLTVFHRKTGINFKRFITEKYSADELKDLSERFKAEVRTCNAFLNHIALDGDKVDVSSVKTALNKLNDEEMHIKLVCIDDNDKEYTLSCTNKMVRVKLVNDAKENADVSGFKSVKVADMLSVIMSGLCKVYHARNDG